MTFHIEAEKNDVWVYDIARATTTRVLVGHHHLPIWTPDGQRLTFLRSGAGAGISWAPADGSGSEQPLTTSTHSQWPESWSPDGRTLAFDELDPTDGWDIRTLSLDGDRKPRSFLRTSFQRMETAVFSRWPLGCVSVERIGADRSLRPALCRSGAEDSSVHHTPDAIMAVTLTLHPSFSAGMPRKLFANPLTGNVSTSAFDVSLDGNRFLVVHGEQAAALRHLNVILGWFDQRHLVAGAD
jgi:hypothetical protein